ncbi:MAG: GDSL-type esterase/lipase family protein [Clostridiales Family XIII bacterium]|jgi:lysophospholipase L1-like esterase|nr:GDSL-type esterase/lipase family protein [Clostridiales Family XIII bacterium]
MQRRKTLSIAIIVLMAVSLLFAGTQPAAAASGGGKTVKVTLNANGGTFADGTAVQTLQMTKGQTYADIYGAAYVPVREGYAFTGWDRSKGTSETVVCIGDSLTHGELGVDGGVLLGDAQKSPVARTGALLGKGWRALNYGVGGTTSRQWADDQNGILSNALSAIRANRAQVVTILLGANDANYAYQITKKDYKSALKAVIKKVKGAGAKIVILHTPSYVDTKKPLGHAIDPKLLKAYRRAVYELVAADAAVYAGADMWQIVSAAPSKFLGVDGVHFTQKGYNRAASYWTAAIRQAVLANVGRISAPYAPTSKVKAGTKRTLYAHWIRL